MQNTAHEGDLLKAEPECNQVSRSMTAHGRREGQIQISTENAVSQN